MLSRSQLLSRARRPLLVHDAQAESGVGPSCASVTDATNRGPWASSVTHLQSPPPSPRPPPTSRCFLQLGPSPSSFWIMSFFSPTSSFRMLSHLFSESKKLRAKTQHGISLLTDGSFSCPHKFKKILKFELPRSFQEEIWTTRYWMSELKSEIRLNDKNDLKIHVFMSIPDVTSPGVSFAMQGLRVSSRKSHYSLLFNCNVASHINDNYLGFLSIINSRFLNIIILLFSHVFFLNTVFLKFIDLYFPKANAMLFLLPSCFFLMSFYIIFLPYWCFQYLFVLHFS